jgi:uncharacterized Zn finger protein
MEVFTAFTEADIRLAAGTGSFERGLHYLDEVEDLEIARTRISASVYGSSKYGVRLAFGAEGLSGDCTCPQGREGLFCKHCVAAGLSVLGMGDDLPQRIEAAQAERQALESWLESLSKEDLLAELLGLLAENRELSRRFELRAASVNQDTATVRRAVRDLIMVSRRDFIDYSQAHEYASDVGQAAVAIDDLIDAGAAAEAIGIAREAIGLLAQAYESVDDSSGSVAAAAEELLAVHLHACQTAPPEPISLGGYLAGLLLDDNGFEPDLGDYADLLGDRGAATVRERIAAAYAEHPEDWRARHLMESMAKAEGNVDALIAIYAADLDDRGWNHLRIAGELEQADRGDEALGWAERGLREAANPHEQLVEYLASRYAAAGRDDDVLSLRRARFRGERTLVHYLALRRAAMNSGGWPAERGQALALLRADARNARRQVAWGWDGPVLVDALIDDDDLDAAWTAAEDGATEAQWLRLADASIAARPADALAFYYRVIGSLKGQTGDAIYRRIAALLLSARACHQALGTPEEFRRYVAALRVGQKRKRNLMKILDENGL